jgi:hypothetical protein
MKKIMVEYVTLQVRDPLPSPCSITRTWSR